mmetsp:Transcript_37081/g.76006  ORF Transcript_37081/g.76006 Transcript_37081/m.76006 type:complete len:242 (-) Transcript_37081:1353-2078(-)
MSHCPRLPLVRPVRHLHHISLADGLLFSVQGNGGGTLLVRLSVAGANSLDLPLVVQYLEDVGLELDDAADGGHGEVGGGRLEHDEVVELELPNHVHPCAHLVRFLQVGGEHADFLVVDVGEDRNHLAVNVHDGASDTLLAPSHHLHVVSLLKVLLELVDVELQLLLDRVVLRPNDDGLSVDGVDVAEKVTQLPSDHAHHVPLVQYHLAFVDGGEVGGAGAHLVVVGPLLKRLQLVQLRLHV